MIRQDTADAIQRQTALAQGLYFLATGIWPLIHLPSFEKVTGPKVDKWLVRTVGLLVSVIGGTLIVGAVRGRLDGQTATLGAGSALALGAVDVMYSANGTISPIYLADAVVEAAIVAAWAAGRPAAHRDGG
jgi:hypothetical protein